MSKDQAKDYEARKREFERWRPALETVLASTTMEELASDVGVNSHVTILHWRRGDHLPSVSNMSKLKAVLRRRVGDKSVANSYRKGLEFAATALEEALATVRHEIERVPERLPLIEDADAPWRASDESA